jgi:hypothetical protein
MFFLYPREIYYHKLKSTVSPLLCKTDIVHDGVEYHTGWQQICVMPLTPVKHIQIPREDDDDDDNNNNNNKMFIKLCSGWEA